MTEEQYTWTDNPTVSGVSPCNTDILNDCLMHLKYNQKSGGSPLPLFTWQFFDHQPNNPSWVQANYSWLNSGYVSAYNLLVEQYDNGTEEAETVGDYTVTYKRGENGMKIVSPDMIDTIDNIYSSTGAAWYYVLDKENERFKLPRSKYARINSNKSTIPVAGNGNALFLTNGTTGGAASLYATSSATRALNYASNGVVYPIGSSIAPNGTNLASVAVGVTTDSAKSGLIAYTSDVIDTSTNMLLYFYLGESQIEDTSITGEVLELINNKADVDLSNCTRPYITETYVNGTSWYRIWSDGWCEEGAVVSGITGKSGTVSLLKTYTNTPIIAWSPVVSTISEFELSAVNQSSFSWLSNNSNLMSTLCYLASGKIN